MNSLATYFERFSSLPGWFMEESAAIWDCLFEFQIRQQIHGHALEIGVYRGKSAALICLHMAQQEKLLLVDPQGLESVKATLLPVKPENVICYSCISRRLPMTDLLALYGRCRWIHIDGEHSASTCSHDLGLADLLLSDQGVLVVDDFMSPRHPQVTASVFNYMHSHPFSFRIFLCGFLKAYLVRPQHIFRYMHFVRDNLTDELIKRSFAERITFYKSTVPDDYNCFGIGRFEGTPMIGLDQDRTRILI
jgi:methyltransferase family protein